jgi:glycosyltransferase involved in cell wall biosynthesis
LENPRTLLLSSHAPPTAGLGLGVEAPRVDIIELRTALGAALSLPPAQDSWIGRIEHRGAFSFSQALRARGAGAGAFLSLSEGVGLPLATFDRGQTPHVMIAHNLLRPRMRGYTHLTKSLRRINRIVVLTRSHGEFLHERLGVARERICFLHNTVDDRFWAPRGGEDDGTVLSVGRENRDYGTLIQAVRPLGAPTVIVAGSLWAAEGDKLSNGPGDHIAFREGITFVQLRELYEHAAVVVVPLQAGVRYAAGISAVGEAMAMGKAVVVTEAPAIEDYVVDAETARVVPSGDPSALREVLIELLADQGQRRRLGDNARAAVQGGRNLDGYVRTLVRLVGEARAQGGLRA